MAKKKVSKNAPGATKKFDFIMDGPRLESVEAKAPKPRLEAFYRENIVPALREKFQYKSVMQVPKLQKICLNIGVGGAVQDPKLLQNAINELELITGQRPTIRKAKNAISNFKLRAGMPIGCMVTLRRANMYEFLDRFINMTAPRIRDFHGFPDKSFDGRGNYTLGIKEQIVFPEIDVDKVNKITGMDITFVMTSNTDEEAYHLLKEFGFPFTRKD
jgi:large subunit ribosomal protein L5